MGGIKEKRNNKKNLKSLNRNEIELKNPNKHNQKIDIFFKKSTLASLRKRTCFSFPFFKKTKQNKRQTKKESIFMNSTPSFISPSTQSEFLPSVFFSFFSLIFASYFNGWRHLRFTKFIKRFLCKILKIKVNTFWQKEKENILVSKFPIIPYNNSIFKISVWILWTKQNYIRFIRTS